MRRRHRDDGKLGQYCDGKRSYPSFSAAERVAKAQRRDMHSRVQHYRCKYCGKWHVGNITAGQEKRKDQRSWDG